MKKYFLPLFAIALLASCGGAEEESSENHDSEETSDEFTPPDCPTSTITMTQYKWDNEADSAVLNDYSFEVAGSAGYFEDGRLMFIVGDSPNDENVDMGDYADVATNCFQVTLDHAATGEYNVMDSHTPIQPYVEGKSIAYFGSASAFPDGEPSGTFTIDELSSEWVCGSVDMIGYHGGVVKGDFSVKLRPKY